MDYRQLQNSVYQNASMGVTALKSMIPMVSDSNVKNLLIRQYNGYKAQKEITARQMKERGITPTEPTFMSRAMTTASVNMQLRRDSSGSNAAKMAIKGTNAGIIELTEKLNHTSCSSPEVIQSAKEYLRREQKNIESLKPYL
ncbi:MAG: hypothetical protein ACI4J0_06170 [Huintestinicola sp.]|uniref:hypothetical protein n=1 Tax=Huintestinicola sp. TaxID=2981661 RepID=UPI003F0837FD